MIYLRFHLFITINIHRFPPPIRPESGTVFPKDGTLSGTRTTTETSKRIIAAALRGIGTEEANNKADEVLKEKSWRFKYNKYYEILVRLGVSNKNAAVDSAKAGLAWVYDNFEFIKDGTAVKFSTALENTKTTPFHTGETLFFFFFNCILLQYT